MKAILVLVLVASAVFASKLDNTRAILYHRSGVPADGDWVYLKEAEDYHKVQFSLALKQQNLDLLEEKFWDNANPKSLNFAKHMTRSEIIALIAPSVENQHLVMNWIYDVAKQQSAIMNIDIDNQKDVIKVTAPVAVVEKLFDTEMHLFINEVTRRVVIKHLGSLSVPAYLSNIIEMVTGITELPPTSGPFYNSLKKARSTAPRQGGDNQCNVPYTIRQLYGIPQDLQVTNANANSSIYAEASSNQEGFGVPSLADFEQANKLPPNPITCILGNGVEDYFVNDTDDEAQLDTQMMEGIAPGAKICFYIMDPNHGWMYEFATQIFNTPNAPLVASMSYGWNENKQCFNATDPDAPAGLGNCSTLDIPNSRAYVGRTNTEFMKLGLAGHSMVCASGDDGAAGNHGSINNCETMGPLFPASSPYVTVVGATSIEPSNGTATMKLGDNLPPVCTDSFYQCTCTTSTNEQIASGSNTAGFDTGGGFAWYSPMPAYQKKAVAAYLNSGVALPSKTYWNASNRGYPDVGAIGENFCCLDPGGSCNLAAVLLPLLPFGLELSLS